MKITIQKLEIEGNGNKILDIDKLECNIPDSLVQTIITLSQSKKTDNNEMLFKIAEEQKNDYLNVFHAIKEEQLRNEIEKLHKEIQTIQMEHQNSIGQLSDSIKDFATNIV